MIATFTAKVSTLDSASLRTLYTELFNMTDCSIKLIDIVLDRLIDVDGVEATGDFIDTVG
jgi:hypothetical protein